MPEIERFLRDAAEERWDGQVFSYPVDEAFHQESIKWYRALFNERNPGHDESLSDQEFLHQWGYLIRKDEILQPTRASIILFGAPAAIHQMLPRPTLDVQWIPSDFGEPLPEIRWLDRMVFEDNLIITWRGLVTSYMQKAEKPFRIDPHTLLRNDAPPDYRVFREAAINLLIHQDYASHGFKAVIKFYRNVIQFWNPGDVFGNADHLLEPGEKEVRNPQIVAAFRRLGLCEQAGTGIRMVLNQWQALGHLEPEYDNDRSRKTFEIRLPLAKDQVTPQVTEQVGKLLWQFGNKPVDGKSLMDAVGILYNTFLYSYLQPALNVGLVEMTIPDKPRSSKQKYRLTDKGKKWVEQNQEEK
jgi:ATP-dependent DNA helicase RecG